MNTLSDEHGILYRQVSACLVFKTLWGKRWRNPVDTNSDLKLVALLKQDIPNLSCTTLKSGSCTCICLLIRTDEFEWFAVQWSADLHPRPTVTGGENQKKMVLVSLHRDVEGCYCLMINFFMVHPHVSWCVTSCLVSLSLPCDCPDLFHLSLISLLCCRCQFVCITVWVTHVSFGFLMPCISSVPGFPSACLCLDQL